MDLRQINNFISIAEAGSISRAAERLHVAQPALSKQLQNLENELGTTLVKRSTRQFMLTEAGARFLYRAKQIIELVETTEKEIKDYEAGIRGTLRIGTLASAASMLLPNRIAAFSKKNPDVEFVIHDCHTHEVIELLNHGLVDIGIIRSPYEVNAYHSIMLPEEPMMVISREEPFWKPSQKEITVADLKDRPLIMHNRYGNVFKEICNENGFEAKLLNQVDDTRTLLLCAKTGMGFALVQRDWLNLIGEDTFYAIPLNEPKLVTQTAIVWLKNKYLPTVAKAFLSTF